MLLAEWYVGMGRYWVVVMVVVVVSAVDGWKLSRFRGCCCSNGSSCDCCRWMEVVAF